MRCLFLISLLLLSSCTTSVKVKQVDLNDPKSRVGIPYPLMFSQFELLVTRRVIECGAETKVSVTTEIKGLNTVPEPDKIFVIDPQSLAGYFKTSEIKVDYAPTGAPIGFNASAEDRTGQVIANVASAIVKVVAFTAVTGSSTKGNDGCSPAASAAVKKLAKQQPEVERLNNEIEVLTQKLKLINKKVAELGINVDESTKRLLSETSDELAKKIQELKPKTIALAKIFEQITYTETIRWPENGDQSVGTFPAPEIVIQKWAAEDAERKQTIKDDLTIKAVLTKLTDTGRNLGVKDNLDPELGIPFRQPVLGRLQIQDLEGKVVSEKIDNILQLGYTYYLPCVSRPFSSVACTYKMNTAGQLENMGSANKASIAEGLTNSAKEIVSKAVEVKELQIGAETKRIAAETALLKAKSDKIAAEEDLLGDPSKGTKLDTAVLKANIDYLTAQKAEIEAEAALEEARKRLN